MWALDLDEREIKGLKQEDFIQLLLYKKDGCKINMFFGFTKDGKWTWGLDNKVFELSANEYLEAVHEAVDLGWERIA